MICASKKNKKKEVPGVARHPHAKEHLKELITTSNGGRLDEYDEFWPVRYSRMKFYGADVPPETPKKRQVRQICIFIDTPTRSILASIEPEPIFGNPKRRAKFCKPLWENRNMAFGLTRRLAGAWQTRHIIANKQMLAVSTQIQFNSTIRRNPEMILYYDFGILEDLGSAEFGCRHRNESQWDFIFDSSPLQWPYFQGCSPAIQIREKS
ncbi:unnamed protein product, partial [Mesorhabditis spiculigera]